MSTDESCGRIAILLLLVVPLRVRLAVFQTLREMGELGHIASTK